MSIQEGVGRVLVSTIQFDEFSGGYSSRGKVELTRHVPVRKIKSICLRTITVDGSQLLQLFGFNRLSNNRRGLYGDFLRNVFLTSELGPGLYAARHNS